MVVGLAAELVVLKVVVLVVLSAVQMVVGLVARMAAR